MQWLLTLSFPLGVGHYKQILFYRNRNLKSGLGADKEMLNSVINTLTLALSVFPFNKGHEKGQIIIIETSNDLRKSALTYASTRQSFQTARMLKLVS